MGCERLGEYTYRWDAGCFPLGADSLALGDFCTLKPRQTVLDLGCGAGLLLLLCARREPTLRLIGVERDDHAAIWAERNFEENDLACELIRADLSQSPLPHADVVVSNPPWYPKGAGAEGGAGRIEHCDLRALCTAASSALSHKGRFATVYCAERLTDLLTEARRAGLEPKRLQLCAHGSDKPPYAVLMEAVKGGRAGLELLPLRVS